MAYHPQQPVKPSVPAQAATLRGLFLTLFLRGRTSRGLQKARAPKSIAIKLWGTLAAYTLFGLPIFFSWKRPVFEQSIFIQATTFFFVGMFMAASGGEILFNKEEADILLHRPVPTRTLLWAKIRVLLEVSLWLAGALNLGSFILGVVSPHGSWLFPFAHALSITLEALFCTGFVVLTYQLCLKWFGRERLDGLMTTVQVLVAVSVTVGFQVIPRVIGRYNPTLDFDFKSRWILALPPAWFAGLDDALVGRQSRSAWVLAGIGLLATAAVLWIAFGRLASEYGRGLQTLTASTATRPKQHQGRRWIDRLVEVPPLRWVLRDPVTRGAFVLTSVYLFRDRDVKLRLYPSLAPLLAMPLVVIVQGLGRHGQFGTAIMGSALGLIPLQALPMLKYSQQWQASDVFRAAPMEGPVPLFHGARWAVMVLLAGPALIAFALVAYAIPHWDPLLLIPGALPLPIYSLYPGLGGDAVPFSAPPQEGRAARRGIAVFVMTMASFAISGVAVWSRHAGWFWWFVAVEAVGVAIIYPAMLTSLATVRWPSLD